MKTIVSIFIALLLITSCQDKKSIGIDISHHNNLTESTWDTLLNKYDVKFCYIKVSEGATWKDPKRFINCDIAFDKGIRTGPYHYFKGNISGKKQYQNFDKALIQKNMYYFVVGLVPVIDVEEPLNKTAIKNLREMVDLMYEDYNDVIIYCPKKYYFILKPFFPTVRFWTAGCEYGFMHQKIKTINGQKIDINYTSNIPFWSD